MRLSSRFVGSGYVFYIVVLAVIPGVVRDMPLTQTWWTPTALALVFVPGVALVIVSFRGSYQQIRRWVVAAGLAYLAAVVLWPLAWTGAHPAVGTWISMMPGLPALAMAMVWRPRWAFVYLFAAVVGVQLINQTRIPEANEPLILEVAFGYGFCVLFVAAMGRAIATGRILDESLEATNAAVASAAAMRARAIARSAYAGLLHDWVMSTLLAAARHDQSDDLRRQAGVALAKLDRIGLDTGSDPYNIDSAVAAMEAAAREVNREVVVSVEAASEEASLPSEVVDAACAGIAEAVRNSYRHAGSQDCRVAITASGMSFSVEIADRGVGFDVAAVSGDRFGVAGSIGRLGELDGGTVHLASRPGGGTVVRLAWTDPTAAARKYPLDVQTLLGMQTRGAWVVAGLFGFGAIAAVGMHNPDGIPVWPSIVALAADAVAVVLLLAARGDPLPIAATCWITFAVPISTAVATLLHPSVFASAAELWPGSLTAAIYAFVCVRGRTAFAWCGQTSVILLGGVWSLMVGHGFIDGFLTRAIDFAPLLMATFFAFTLRPAARQIYDRRAEITSEVASQAAATEAIREKRRQLDQLDEMARVLLSRIHRQDSLTSEDRRTAMMLEAHLRTSLRAPGLVTSITTPTITAARARGVIVDLKDEHGLDDSSDEVRNRLLANIARELAKVDAGTAAIRISPPGRGTLATFVVRDSGAARRVEFGHDGEVRPSVLAEC